MEYFVCSSMIIAHLFYTEIMKHQFLFVSFCLFIALQTQYYTQQFNLRNLSLQQMSKQNQLHQHLYRPFPHQNPQLKYHNGLSIDSNCQCPPCKSRPIQIAAQILMDKELEQLKYKKINNLNLSNNNGKTNSSLRNKTSDLIIFLNQIYKYSKIALPNIQILDTVVFNSDGSVKFIVSYEAGKFRISKLSSSLKNYIGERKYSIDLQYQKKKFQRQHMGFSFTQLDHQSQKYIKQFQNNIKYMNPLLNRVAITKLKSKQEEEIISQYQLNNIFVKISRKLFDFTMMEYMQVFPIMYGHQESSYIKKIKYFRQKEISKKHFKIAQHYIGNWYTKNQTLQNMEAQFLNSIKNNQDETLMYYTYKLFIFFQKISNKMVECALLSFITNDEGNTFYLKNIQYLNLFNLHEVQQRGLQLPRKLQNQDVSQYINLKTDMKLQFNSFQLNYQRLERERKQMEQKLQRDIDFSNQVYESLGNTIPKYNKSSTFIKSIIQKHSGQRDGKIILDEQKDKFEQL